MRIPIHNPQFNIDSERLIPRKRVYTVFVVPRYDNKWLIYHCPDCRNPIAQYKGEMVAEIPGEAPRGYPVLVQCKNPKCGRKIMFADAIEQV